jgi:hypothetical protein
MQPATIDALRAQFNATPAESVRVVALLSPTCLVCQYGAGVVRTLFEVTPSAALIGLVVWVPMMDADTVDEARREAADFVEERITHLWDGERIAGGAFADTLGLIGTAWDVYLLYPAGVLWESALPPAPAFWMHQLPSATHANAGRLLVPGVFAGEVRTLLGSNAVDVSSDMALFLHAKALSRVRGSRIPQSLEEIAEKAVRR